MVILLFYTFSISYVQIAKMTTTNNFANIQV
jgi:hypothetical protein